MSNHDQIPVFIYTFANPMEEMALCQMEMRAFFGKESKTNMLKSTIEIDPSRSPFIKERIKVIYEGDELQDIIDQVGQMKLSESTFKVILAKINEPSKKIDSKQRRKIEREVGLQITGNPDLQNPESLFGIVIMAGRWYFGLYEKSEAIWFQHKDKLHHYSTALSTRVARAIVNIAVPFPKGLKVIDPCCGIGTVLIEGLSMGIDIVGRDINAQVASGARQNIIHFGLEGEVITGAIAEVTKEYDVAIIDMPYNIFSKSTQEEQLSILKHAQRIAKKVIVVMIDINDKMLDKAGFAITDRCVTKKGLFTRQILICEKKL